MNTTERIAAAFARVQPKQAGGERAVQELAREARHALERWGHGEREVVLQPVNAFSDPARRAACSGASTAASPSR
ncbi:MAG: hypothetical protein OXG27_14575 [Chloroflexi bacterium]|nr:hypothetical protein [Chloroflexota bacterium]